MSERLSELESQIDFWQTKKTLAIEALQQANAKLLELGSERNRLIGNTAVRHLHVVPDLPPTITNIDRPPDGAA